MYALVHVIVHLLSFVLDVSYDLSNKLPPDAAKAVEISFYNCVKINCKCQFIFIYDP